MKKAQKRRTISLLLSALCASCGFLAACGGGGRDSEYVYRGNNVMDNLGPSTGTISFMVYGGWEELQNWDNLIEDFESKNPGITVETVTIPDGDMLYTNLAGGTAPDVVQLGSPQFGIFAKQGAFQSLQPFIERDNFDTSDFWPQAIEMFSFDTERGVRGSGELFGLPKDLGVNGIFVNRTLIEEARDEGRLPDEQYALVTDQVNPMTFEEYIDVAVALTQYDGTANSVYGSNRIYWESYLWSLGDDIITSEHTLNKSDLVKKVFNYSKAMVTEGDPNFCSPYTPVDSSSSQTEESQFLTGKLAMIWAGRWRVPIYDEAGIDYYCIPIPIADPSEAENTLSYSISWTSTVGYAISRNCQKTEMAWKFIQYLTSPDGYRQLNRLNFNVPGRMSLIEEDEFRDPKTYNSDEYPTNLDEASAKLFFDMAKVARLNNDVRYTENNWKTLFENRLSMFFNDEIKTVDEFLDGVEAEVNAAIRQSDPWLFEE